MSVFDILRKFTSRDRDALNTSFPAIEKFDGNLTPNLRALRLSMSIADLLLSMGVSANSVVSQILDITERYCSMPVHVDILANLILISQLRGIDKEPLTLVRPVGTRAANYMTIQKVQRLVRSIDRGELSLDKAEIKFNEIIDGAKSYPWWVVMLGNGILVAGVAMMFTSSVRDILVTFVIGIAVDRLLYFAGKLDFPGFFKQIIAAAFVTFVAALINYMGKNGIEFFSGMNPTLVVVGGIIMLVAGLAFVGAIQDAIEEYYLTANSRMTKVLMQTIGIVVGIMVGLYFARKLEIGIAVSPDPLLLNTVIMQIIGSGFAAAGYALSTHTYSKAILQIGTIGGITIAIYYWIVHTWGVSVVPASGIAALFVGISASLVSRFWRTPSVGIISAGIIPLVPGLMLYNGLMQLINYPPGNPMFFKALGTLFAVITTGLAIAAGASFGNMISRPMKRKLAHARNLAQFTKLSNWRFVPKRHRGLASYALNPSKLLNFRGKNHTQSSPDDL